MRTLHFGLRVADLERSLAFYTAVGYEVVGSVPETALGHLTMLKLPGDDFVTVELVHDPTNAVDDGAGLSHFVIKVESMEATITALAAQGIHAEAPDHRLAQTTLGRRGSPTRTVTGSSWSSGRPVTPTASPRPTCRTEHPLRKASQMGKTIMGAVVSLDGYIADDHDRVGPLFDWYGNGDVRWAFEGGNDEFRTTQASADFMRAHYAGVATVVMGRRLFDLTNGWNGQPAAGEHVFVVTHQPPKDWEHAGTAPFTFVDGVQAASGTAQQIAGDRIVDVAAGQIGGQALRLGLIDQVVVNLVPVVLGSGRPFFATGPLDDPILLGNPSQVVRGDRVTHLVYDVAKG